MMNTPKTIVITGASSGLGAALANHYASHAVILHLQGRNAARLNEVALQCRNSGATVHTSLLDVTDAPAMEAWLNSLDDVDLVIANAGISAGTGGGGESAHQARIIFATNIDGIMNTIQPLLAKMVARKRGQIAIISSLAGIRGLPSSPAYSASKACVRFYGEGLRGWLASHQVKVSVVCPGYIKTPMTAVNDFPMPLLMTPEKAARIIARGLAKNRSRIAFPLPLYLPLWFLSCLSPTLTDGFFARLPSKPALPE
jgi:short-subunit dehydrogenase